MSSCEILDIATLAAYFIFDTGLPYNDSGPNVVPTTSSNTAIITGYKNQAILFTGTSNSYFQTWGFTSLGISNKPLHFGLNLKFYQVHLFIYQHLHQARDLHVFRCWDLLRMDQSLPKY
jgi:hypothetical protein